MESSNLGDVVSFDRGYDDAGRSMSTVTCSDGPNGLMKKYPTQGALPGFPHIGGVPGVGWNSPSVRHFYHFSPYVLLTLVPPSDSAFSLPSPVLLAKT